jgi:hypothetical protein
MPIPWRHICKLRKRLTSLFSTTNSTQMKRILQIAAVTFLVILGSSWRNNACAQVYNDDISYQTFYDDLEPYGQWMDYPDYGYVWVPNCGPDFRPYSTNGHWVWTDEYEWMWVSDYSWGWAPFHYGRWLFDSYYGWIWVPGYEWAPAWVAWRDGGDYYGWAPLRPGFSLSINFSIGNYNPPIDYWCFAPRRYISSPRIYDYCLDRSRNVTIINNTTIINNYNRRNNVFVTGPRRIDAERYAGRINPVRFREASGPGRGGFRNNEVSIYRPRVERDNNRQFAPRSFQRYDRNRANLGDAVRRERDNNNNNNDRGNGNNLPRPGRDDNRFDRRNEAAQQPNNDIRRNERRNIFDRRNDQQPGNYGRNPDAERERNFNDRNRNNQGNNDQNTGRSFERPQQPQQPQQRNEERRNMFERNRDNNSFQNRREMSNNDNSSRQQAPQRMERQQQQPRQFENHGNPGNREQRGGSDNGRGHGRRG